MRNHFCTNFRKFQIELNNHIMGLIWGHSVWFSRLWEAQIETPVPRLLCNSPLFACYLPNIIPNSIIFDKNWSQFGSLETLQKKPDRAKPPNLMSCLWNGTCRTRPSFADGTIEMTMNDMTFESEYRNELKMKFEFVPTR